MDKIRLEYRIQKGRHSVFSFLASSIRKVRQQRIQTAFAKDLVLLNGTLTGPGTLLRQGDIVEIDLPGSQSPGVFAENIPLDIVYEDEAIILIDKPCGMACHKGLGTWNNTVLNALMHYYQASGQDILIKDGLAHRLDKDTSGLLLLGKTKEAKAILQEQFRKGTVKKKYLAVVKGIPEPHQGIIDQPVGRNPDNHHDIGVFESGKEAVTRYRLLRNNGNYSLLECEPLTGRTHQIRIHLKHIGHPIVGDKRYSEDGDRYPRLFLHAATLQFNHPFSGAQLEFEAAMPDAFKLLLN